MGHTRKLRRGQAGGRWLAEGADGCIFSAPHNWPCENPAELPSFNPEDPTVAAKIVATDDFEDVIMRLFPPIRKKYRIQNIPEYIGSCKPRMSHFEKRKQNDLNVMNYFSNLRRKGKTKKGCRAWALNFQAGRPRKMYVYRKYKMTYADYIKDMKESAVASKSLPQMAALLAHQARTFHRTLSVLTFGNPYQILHYDMHSKNIVLYEKKGKVFDPLDGSTFEIGPADFGRALWRDTTKPLTPDTWDVPYYDHFLTHKRDGRYAEFSQFSLENRLFSYVSSHLDKKGAAGKTWLERWATDPDILREIERGSQDPLYWALPTLLSVFPTSPKWRQFETQLEQLVRLLSDEPTHEKRATALGRNPPLRRFFDRLKARSMLPVAFGLFLRGALYCCGISKEEAASVMRSPAGVATVPASLRPAFRLYWRELMTVVV
jgi:hypothetical protein